MQVPEGISAVPRSAVVNRLLALDWRGELTSRHVELMASVAGVSERTLWRWLRAARETGNLEAAKRGRVVVDENLRRRLAYWRGNVAAVHRELTAEAAAAGGGSVPSLRTLHRVVVRDLTAGERAGLHAGERARRAHDVYLSRPVGHRNEVWETDHVEVPVEVAVGDKWRKPWVTWFVDVATGAVCGLAVTPG